MNGKDVAGSFHIDDRKQRVAKRLFRDGRNRSGFKLPQFIGIARVEYPLSPLTWRADPVRLKVFSCRCSFWKDKTQENTDR